MKWIVPLLLLFGCGAGSRLGPAVIPVADLPGGTTPVATEGGVALSVSGPNTFAVLGERSIQQLHFWEPVTVTTMAISNLTVAQYDAPHDIDATNGQDLYVADGSRVRRFSDEGLEVQMLSIPAVDPANVSAAPA